MEQIVPTSTANAAVRALANSRLGKMIQETASGLDFTSVVTDKSEEVQAVHRRLKRTQSFTPMRHAGSGHALARALRSKVYPYNSTKRGWPAPDA